MNAQVFRDNFEHIANAPNGVAKLRELILSLAVQGKLVSQNPNDQPVDALLKEIEKEKARLSRDERLHSNKYLPEVSSDEMPHRVPPNWQWVRFGQIAQHNSGKTLDSKRNTGHPRDYITTSNVYWGAFDLKNLRHMLIRDEELARCTARRGDLLICEGGEAGRAAVWPHDHDVAFQNHIHRARFYCGISPYYGYRFLQKLNDTGEINLYRKGMGISNLSSKALALIPIPLPPLDEQERIVAKVDQLMALCDRLEVKQNERAQRLPTLSRACHTRLVENPTSAALSRIFGEIGILSTQDLRKTILTLAAQGKLVPQDPNDTSPLKTFPGLESTPRTPEDEHQARHQWVSATYAALTTLVTSGSRGWKEYYANSGAIFIRTQNIKTDRLMLDDVAHVLLPESTEGLRARVKRHDILITITGANVTKAARVEIDIPEAYVSQHIALTRPRWHEMSEWLHLCLISHGAARSTLERLAYGDKPGLGLDQIRNLVLPIPPLAEQRRIIAKVGQLMTLVDILEQQYRERNRLAEALAKAVVASFTDTQTEEKDAMKPPKTELISLLKLGTRPKHTEEAPLAKLLMKAQGKLSAKALWQQSGLPIDAFYLQLKLELGRGWIAPPPEAEMRQTEEYPAEAELEADASIPGLPRP